MDPKYLEEDVEELLEDTQNDLGLTYTDGGNEIDLEDEEVNPMYTTAIAFGLSTGIVTYINGMEKIGAGITGISALAAAELYRRPRD